MIRGLNAGAREVPRSELDALTEHVRRYGAGGLVWAFVQEDGTWRSPTAKFLTEEQVGAVTRKLGGAPGDLLLIVADKPHVAATALGELRLELARRFDLVPEGRHDVLWVVDFPMFEYDEAEQRWNALHHPFTAPTGSFEDPGALRSRAYDIVLDGVGDRRRVDPYQPPRGPAAGLPDARHGGGGGAVALRLPARRAALRRAAARRARARHRPDRGDPRGPRLDPRRDGLPEDGERLRSADGRARGGRRRPARRARAQGHGAAAGRLIALAASRRRSGVAA